MSRWRAQSVPQSAPARMLRVVTLAAVLVLAGLAAALWLSREPAGPEPHPQAAGLPERAAPTAPPVEEDGQHLFMSDESRNQQAASVAAIVGTGAQGGKGALAELALVKLDAGSLLWVAGAKDSIPRLRPDLLARVRDYNKVGTWWDNEGEAAAYCDALIKAHNTPAAILARNARRDLTFAHLFEEPAKYRGDVVHVQGRLMMLTRYDPLLMAAQAGVGDLYEGWVFDPRTGNPYCVIFSELPPGVVPGERVDYPVSFDGYSFKRYRYKSIDSNKANQYRDAPLLIGRTVTLLEPPVAVAGGDAWSGHLLPGFMLLLALSVGLTAGMAWWFRREDQKVRSRVQGFYRGEFVEPSPDPTPPVAAPVGSESSAKRLAANEPKKNQYSHGHDKARAVHRALGQGGIDSS